MTEVEWHLGKFAIGLIIVILSQGVKLLVGIGVNDFVTPIVVGLAFVDHPLGRG
jgi:hypothetical protein